MPITGLLVTELLLSYSKYGQESRYAHLLAQTKTKTQIPRSTVSKEILVSDSWLTTERRAETGQATLSLSSGFRFMQHRPERYQHGQRLRKSAPSKQSSICKNIKFLPTSQNISLSWRIYLTEKSCRQPNQIRQAALQLKTRTPESPLILHTTHCLRLSRANATTQHSHPRLSPTRILSQLVSQANISQMAHHQTSPPTSSAPPATTILRPIASLSTKEITSSETEVSSLSVPSAQPPGLSAMMSV